MLNKSSPRWRWPPLLLLRLSRPKRITPATPTIIIITITTTIYH